MEKRRLGKDGPEVSAVGLGAMGMSDLYGPRDDGESLATLRRALELGVNFIDTADFYGMGHNEELISKAIAGRREDVVLSVKFGQLRTPGGGFGPFDGRPEYVRHSLAGTLRRLGTDYVDLYTPSRVPHDVPVEETVGAISELVEAGYVRYVGLSEAAPETVRRAHAVHPVTAVQTEYSLWSREPEDGLLATLRELGIGLVAYSPLSRGFLSGQIQSPNDFAPDDFRRMSPRFQGENFRRNLELVGRVRGIAEEKGCTPAQLAIAWVLARGEDVVPLTGTRNRGRLEENLGALGVRLTEEDLERMEEAMPRGAAAGERYPAPLMAHVNR
jgi:aryl-alcohol dehydrogenase-like predicted oxidoreductase